MDNIKDILKLKLEENFPKSRDLLLQKTNFRLGVLVIVVWDTRQELDSELWSEINQMIDNE